MNFLLMQPRYCFSRKKVLKLALIFITVFSIIFSGCDPRRSLAEDEVIELTQQAIDIFTQYKDEDFIFQISFDQNTKEKTMLLKQGRILYYSNVSNVQCLYEYVLSLINNIEELLINHKPDYFWGYEIDAVKAKYFYRIYTKEIIKDVTGLDAELTITHLVDKKIEFEFVIDTLKSYYITIGSEINPNDFNNINMDYILLP